MAHRITTEVDVDAECPDCGADLICTKCDEDKVRDEFNVPTFNREYSAKLLDQLRALYETAINEGRNHDRELLTNLISWLQEEN